MREPSRHLRSTVRWSRPGVATLAAVVLLAAAACASGQGSIARDYELQTPAELTERGGGATARFVVGSKGFAEQEILGQITVLALRAAGAEVVDRTGLGGTGEVRDALLLDEIDMYWEYTGTGWLIHLAQADAAGSSEDGLYQQLADLDRQQNGVEWVAPAPADNTYAIALREDVDDPELAAVETMSDFARLVRERPDQATLCAGPEFSERADGLPGLAERYGFEVAPTNLAILPDQTVYGAVDQGEKCAFGSVFETNGLVSEFGLRLLEDDQGFFAPYQPSLTMRTETLQRYPSLDDLFGEISAQLDTATLRRLSADVLVRNVQPADVAERWLRERGFI